MTTTRTMDRWRFAIVIVALIAAMMVAGQFDAEDEAAEARIYCEMIAIWAGSNGEFGWPNDDKTYAQACPPIPLEGGEVQP